MACTKITKLTITDYCYYYYIVIILSFKIVEKIIKFVLIG